MSAEEEVKHPVKAGESQEKIHHEDAVSSNAGTEEAALQDYAGQPFYRKPVSQVFLVSLTCFLCPGMFNALSGLGGGGMQDKTTVNNGNVALYSTFAVFGFFGGTICNKIGPRVTLFIGSLGYGLYMASLYATTQHATQGAQDFVVAAGAILGVCAGLLWTAQGSIMLSYATEERKGAYIALFWAVFNMGAVIGAIVPLARNWNSDAGSVDDYTYIIFMALCFCGAFLPFLLSPTSKVILPNGKAVAPPRHPSWSSEIKGLYMALRFDYSVILLFPLFFSSNYFYTYQFNALNGSGYFNLRARTLQNLCYWLSQIFGAGITGFVLDLKFCRRRVRALVGWASLFAICMAVFAGDFVVTEKYTRESIADPDFVPVDIYDDGYAGYIWLYIFNGILDACWQTFVYWLMGALSNDPRKLAYMAGWYKGLQSAGAAVAWRVDAVLTPYMTQLAAVWGLCGAVLLIALPQVYFRVQNQTQEEAVDEAGDLAVQKERE